MVCFFWEDTSITFLLFEEDLYCICLRWFRYIRTTRHGKLLDTVSDTVGCFESTEMEIFTIDFEVNRLLYMTM